MKKVAIQGVLGSFHHQVAREYYGADCQVVECMSFDALASHLFSGVADQAVMAIENSIAGSIIPNYAIINDYNFYVIGEHYIPIEHHLLALEGQSIEQIKEVHSHPMALLQCKVFLKRYPHLKIVETPDTAASARYISEEKWQGIAAIAGSMAAELYKLEKIAEGIETVKSNMTRFVILSRVQPPEAPNLELNKASMRFVLGHKRGSLAAALNVMSDCKLNLTKIQSLPIIDIPWKYAFFVDATFESYADYEKAVSLLKIMADDFKILGTYKNARK